MKRISLDVTPSQNRSLWGNRLICDFPWRDKILDWGLSFGLKQSFSSWSSIYIQRRWVIYKTSTQNVVLISVKCSTNTLLFFPEIFLNFEYLNLPNFNLFNRSFYVSFSCVMESKHRVFICITIVNKFNKVK